MSHIGFIGLGNMGGPMVRNLIRAGHSLKVFDLSEEAINFAVQLGAVATKSVKEAAIGVDFVLTMLPVPGLEFNPFIKYVSGRDLSNTWFRIELLISMLDGLPAL